MNEPGDSTLAMEAGPLPGLEPAQRLSLTIIAKAGDWSAFDAIEAKIAAAAAACARHPRCARARAGEATVVLGDDALVRSLNAAYRGQDKPTNVLSFPFRAPPGAGEPGPLGDVVLAAETVAREASEQGTPPVHHLQHLVVHGLLHLLGFEHAAEADAADMEGVEIAILATLGVADPYAPAGGG